jgi:hypothetical protein
LLNTNFGLERTKSKSGDDCHANIVNLSDNQAANIIKNAPISDFIICDENGARSITCDEAKALREQYDTNLRKNVSSETD